MTHAVLPSITTHSITASSWRDKLVEVETLGLTQFALFLTGISVEERMILFDELAQLRRRHSFEIPFVHAVSTMKDSEYRKLVDEYGTKAFNLHPESEFPLHHPLSAEIRRIIFVENATQSRALEPQDLSGFAGICLDVSHLEDTRRNFPAVYDQMVQMLATFPIGANHISAVAKDPVAIWPDWLQFSHHVSTISGDMDYLREYPAHYFSPLCALELENSIAEQLLKIAEVSQVIDAAVGMSSKYRIAA
jgi:hypothetical protein